MIYRQSYQSPRISIFWCHPLHLCLWFLVQMLQLPPKINIEGVIMSLELIGCMPNKTKSPSPLHSTSLHLFKQYWLSVLFIPNLRLLFCNYFKKLVLCFSHPITFLANPVFGNIETYFALFPWLTPSINLLWQILSLATLWLTLPFALDYVMWL